LHKMENWKFTVMIILHFQRFTLTFTSNWGWVRSTGSLEQCRTPTRFIISSLVFHSN